MKQMHVSTLSTITTVYVRQDNFALFSIVEDEAFIRRTIIFNSIKDNRSLPVWFNGELDFKVKNSHQPAG